MPPSSPLFNLRLTCEVGQLPIVEEAFSEDSLAITVLEHETPPALEILYEKEPSPALVKAKLASLIGEIGGKIPAFNIIRVDQMDWIKKVCENLEPIPIARWTISGEAFRHQIPCDTLGLQIDATSAFGTGEHPTTRGCLIMLDKLLKRHPSLNKGSMLDMGCGSGILAMAYVKAANGSGLGIDMDEQSVEIAQENLRANGLTESIHIECGTGYANQMIAQRGPYDLIMANVFADPLREMAADLYRNLKPGGFAILSGILNHQAQSILTAHQQQGLRLLHKMRLDAWSVLALYRPKRAS